MAKKMTKANADRVLGRSKAMRKAARTRADRAAGVKHPGIEWKRPAIVEVMWRDATGKVSWHEMGDARAIEPATVYSTGYLITDTEVGVRIGQDLAFDTDAPGDDPHANGVGVIPRACIVRVKVLREAGKP